MPKRREETEGKAGNGERKPDPPGALPEMVVDQGGNAAGNHPQSKPERVSAQEIVNVVVTVSREGAGAEQDHNSNGKQTENSEKQDVRALAMHQS
jgi:hypothetical protein